MKKKVALVIGAGTSLGSAVARCFAKDGLTAVVARRTGEELSTLKKEIEDFGGTCHPFSLDARKEDDVINLINKIENEIGEIEVAVYNIGANIKFGITETTSQKYYKVWEMAAFGAFLMGREVAKKMIPRKKGTIIFTGATASVRGGDGFAAFAGAKHAKRALAQSMARELGPKGIHVAHVIIDGAIDTPWVNKLFPDYVKEKKKIDGLMNPDDIASNYIMLHKQSRNAWTQELDLRPWVEKW
jgi:NAD(P)-dependent dehydrogenase (short-subunit alcohol dehydrogenase family)